jgi:hypothetical protein
MNRRDVLTGLAATAVAGTLGPADAAPTGGANTFLEIKTYKLHNSFENQFSRLSDFLRASYLPALGRAGAKLVGAFNNYIGPDSPLLITVTQYGSLSVMQDSLAKLTEDNAYQKELGAIDPETGFPFVRLESSLLRTFDGMPDVALADPNDHRPPRVFELRTYESQTQATLAKKLKMFNSGGEIAIFQRLGLRPVFFGETIVGPRQPSLTYMLSFDDLAAREKLWHDFVTDPEWKRLSSQPGLSDAQIVSNITNTIVRPLSFSLIR